MKKIVLTLILSATALFSQTKTPNWPKLPLMQPGTVATAGSITDTSQSNLGINGLALRMDYFLNHWFTSTDSARNFLILTFGDTVGTKINFTTNGRARIDIQNTKYRPGLNIIVTDTGGYGTSNLARFKVNTLGGKSLAEIGVVADGEGYVSGRRSNDSSQAFHRFWAAWNDSIIDYVNGNEVARYDTNGLTLKRDLILNNGGTLTSPTITFKQLDGSNTDSAKISMTSASLGVSAISFDHPIQLPQFSSASLTGKSNLLLANGDTLIFKNNSAVISRAKLSGASSGQFLGWNGSAWVPLTPPAGGGGGTGTNLRVQLANGSVNIYPDTTLTLDTLNFSLATGVGYEAKINLSQNIHTGASPTFAGLTLGASGSLVIKNSGSKLATITHAAGSNNPNFVFPNLSGSFVPFMADGGQTISAGAVWNGAVIGGAYTTHSNGKQIQDSSNARAVGDTISVPWYFTGGMSSYNSGFANSLRFGRGATVTTNATAVGDATSAGGVGSTALGYQASSGGGSAVAIGGSTVASALSSTSVGTLAQATASYGLSLGYGATASGVRSIALGTASSSASYDSSIALNTTATGKHHVELHTLDTLVIPSGYIKANGVIVRADEVRDSMFVRSGFQRVAKYVQGLTGASWVRGGLADPRPAIVPLTGAKIYCKTDSIVIEAYQTFDLDSAKFDVGWVK